MMKTERGFKMEVVGDEPREVKEVFDWYEENFGFVPNLSKVLSTSPAALRSYWLVQQQLQLYGVLSHEEHNLVQMTIAVENRCKYCTSGHHMIGKTFFGSSEEDIQALRESTTISTKKFEALRKFTLEVYRKQGRISDLTLDSFLQAGYNHSQAVEVVANIAVKVLSNLTNQLTLNELDAAIVPFAEGLFEEDKAPN